MVAYLYVTCPGCRRQLRIRKQYIGLEVSCSHCARSFPVLPSDEKLNPNPPHVVDLRNPPKTEERQEEKKAADLSAELQRVHDEVARLASESLQSKSRIHDLETEGAALRSQLQHTQLELADSRQRERSLAELPRQLTDARDELEQLRDQAKILERQAGDAARLEAAQLANSVELDKLRAECQGLLETSRSIESERDGLKAERQVRQTEIECLRDNLAEQKLRSAEAQLRLEAAHDVLVKEYVQARKNWLAEQLSLEQRLALERTAVQAAERQRLDQDARAAQQQRQSDEHLAALEGRCDKLQHELDAERSRLLHEVGQLRQMCDAQQAELHSVGTERDRLARQCEQIQESLQETGHHLAAELAQARKETDSLRMQMDESRRHAESLASQRDRFAAQHQESEAARREIDCRLHEAIETQSAERTEQQRRVETLTAELADSQLNSEKLRSLIRSLENQLSHSGQIEHELSEKTSEAARLQTALQESRTQLSATTAEGVSLRANLRAETEKNELLRSELANEQRSHTESLECQKSAEARLDQELTTVIAERDSLKVQSRADAEQLQSLRAELARQRQTVSESSEHHQAAHAKLARELAGAASQCESLKVQSATDKEQLQSLRDELAKQRQVFDESIERERSIQADLAQELTDVERAATAERNSFEQQLEQAQSKSETLDRRIQEQTIRATSETSEWQKRLDSLQSRFGDLEKERDSIEQKARRDEEEYAEFELEFARQTEGLQAELKSTRTENDTLRSRLITLEGFESRSQQLTDEIAAHNLETIDLQAQLQLRIDQANLLQLKLDQSVAEQKTFDAEIGDLKSQLAAKEASLKDSTFQFESRLATAAQELDEARSKWALERRELETQAELAQSRASESERLIGELQADTDCERAAWLQKHELLEHKCAQLTSDYRDTELQLQHDLHQQVDKTDKYQQTSERLKSELATARSEIEDLQGKCRRLEIRDEEANQLAETLESKRHEIQELQSEVLKLNERQFDTERERDELRSRQSSTTSEITELQELLNQQTSALTEAEAQIEVAKTTFTQQSLETQKKWASERGELEQRIDQEQRNRQATELKVSELLASAATDKLNWQNQIDEHKARHRSELEKLRAESERQLQETQENHAEQLCSQELLGAVLQDELANARSEHDRLQDQFNAIENQLRDTQQQIEAKHSEVLKGETKLRESHDAQNALVIERDELNSRLAADQRELDQLRTRLEEQDRLVKETAARHKMDRANWSQELAEMREEWKTDRTSSGQEIEREKAKTAEVARQLAELQLLVATENREWQQRLESIKQQRDELERHWRESEARVEQEAQEHKELRSELVRANAELRVDLTQVRSEAAALRERNYVLQQFEKDAKRLEQDLAARQSELMQLRESLRTADSELETLRAEQEQWTALRQSESEVVEQLRAKLAEERKEFKETFAQHQSAQANQSQQYATNLSALESDRESLAGRLELQSAKTKELEMSLDKLRESATAEKTRWKKQLKTLRLQRDRIERERLKADTQIRQQIQDHTEVVQQKEKKLSELESSLSDSRTRTEQLQARIPSLEAKAVEADRLAEELNYRRQEADQREAMTFELQNQLKGLRADRDHLKSLHEASKAELDQLHAKLNQLDATLAETRTNQEAGEARHAKELDSLRDQWAAEVKSLESVRESDRAEREKLGREIEDHELMQSMMQSELDSATTELAKIQNRLQSLEPHEAEAKQLQSELAHAHGELAGVQTELRKLQSQWSSAQADRESLQTQLLEAGQESELSRKKLSEIAETLRKATEQHEANQNQWSIELADARATWAAERLAIETQRDSERGNRESLQQSIRDLQAASAAERNELRAKLEAIESQRGQLEERQRQTERRLKLEVEELLRERRQHEETSSTLQAQLAQARSRLEELQGRLVDIEPHVEKAKQLGEQFTRVLEDLSQLRTEHQKLRAAHDALNSERDKIEGLRKSDQRENDRLQNQLREQARMFRDETARLEAKQSEMTRTLSESQNRWAGERAAIERRWEQEVAERKDLEKQLRELYAQATSEKSVAQARIQELQRQGNDLGKKREEIENALQARIDQITRSLQESEQQNARLVEDARRLESQPSRFKTQSELAEAQRQIEELNRLLRKSRIENDELRSIIMGWGLPVGD